MALYVSGGSIRNASGGTITGGNAGAYAAGGYVSNASGGVISGTIRGVLVQSYAGTISNAGAIEGNGGSGVLLANGGTVTNASGGTISGSIYGIYIDGHGGTVANAGGIWGGNDAILFDAGYSNRLIVYPGATFTGTVDGGNTIGATSVSTLELSAGGTGTMTGLGTQFTNFAQGTIDSGTKWTMSGTNSLAAGETLTNSGTLTDYRNVDQQRHADREPVPHEWRFTDQSNSGLLTATYVYGLPAGAADTIVNQGSISGSGNFAIFSRLRALSATPPEASSPARCRP